MFMAPVGFLFEGDIGRAHLSWRTSHQLPQALRHPGPTCVGRPAVSMTVASDADFSLSTKCLHRLLIVESLY
jgi:hypothetical protein